MCAVALLLFAATSGVDAQIGGLLKKKAGEVLKPKPTETKPAPPETKPATEPAPSTAPATTAAPAATPAAAPAAAPAPAASTDPLDESNLNIERNVNHIIRSPERETGRIPFFNPATVAAMKLLDNNGRVALVQKTAPTIKALVQSETFAKAHAEYIKSNFNAVDHGIVAKDLETMFKTGDTAGAEAYRQRQMAMNIVDQVEQQSAADIQRTLGVFLPMWKQSAQQSTGANKAKYERMVKDGEALAAAGTGDVVKMRRSFAVLMSLNADGIGDEAKLYAMREEAKKEVQQIAWNQYNLNAVVKKQLTTFVTECGTVDFTAKTEVKNNRDKFVNAAYERKSDIWKACYRAGQPATNAARQFAQGWLKELK